MSIETRSDSSLSSNSVPDEHSRRLFLKRAGAMAVLGTAVTLAGSRIAKADTEDSANDLNRYRIQGEYFREIQGHENDHVAYLVKGLGRAARPKPTFVSLIQPNIYDFVILSQALEDTGVGAYLSALPAIYSRDYIGAAGSIALIEARHAGYLNTLVERPITANILDFTSDNSFETPLSIAEVVKAAGSFIKSLNGGPPLTFSSTPSASNDIAILNFALALEYLEAEFYNENVPRFYR